MSKPELIIFDMGRVLVDFDFKKAIRKLKAHSPRTEEEIHRYFATTPLWDAFERGTIDPASFFKALEKDLGLSELTYELFAPMWNDIFKEMPETLEIVQSLKGRYKLAVLSNVNQMHWEHLKASHTFLEWFDFPIASYAVGHRKPELEIYHIALRRAGVAANNAIFIDDVEAHILAAKSLGIRGHHFQNAKKLRAELKDVLDGIG